MHKKVITDHKRLMEEAVVLKATLAETVLLLRANTLALLGDVDTMRDCVNERIVLTRAEKDVMAWTSQGYTSAEIAHGFGRSVRTIEKHRATILAKHKASNTSELHAKWGRY